MARRDGRYFSEGEALLQKLLEKVQKREKARKTLALLLVLCLLGVLGYFLWGLIPRQYVLNITGGEVLGNRHYVVKMLQGEAAKKGVSLVIHPLDGSFTALEQVSRGQLDVAFIQGGLGEKKYPGVVHVATIVPELLHFLARPGIHGVQDLRGKTVNMGSKSGGTRVVTHTILEFSGLQSGTSYAEKNHTSEELISYHAAKLPDAVFLLSTAPSYVVEYLVKERGYQVLELPFPAALALRHGWVGCEKILAYTYNADPPVPPRDIDCVGVNMHIVANSRTDSRAVFNLLEALYSPQLRNALRLKLDPTTITIPSGYPLSQGTLDYLNKDTPLFSTKRVEQLRNVFGAFMSLLTTILIVVKWFKGPRVEAVQTQDREFLQYIGELVRIEKEIEKAEEGEPVDPSELLRIAQKLTALRIRGIDHYTRARLDDVTLMDRFLSCVDGARDYVNRLRDRYPANVVPPRA